MEQDYLTIGINVVIILLLTFLAQTFTGLNIGLMSLDTTQLQVLINVPNKDETARKSAKYARKILPIRQKGNLLLCTILLGTAATIEGMAVLLDEYAGGFVGWVVTTLIIVIFGEIVPQSICTRFGLKMAAMGLPIIQLSMIMFYPVTKPLAMVLDRVFPERENLLDRSQLRALVEYQQAAMPGMLATGQAEMLIGALGVTQRTVEEVMVPMEKVFKISTEDKLEYEFVASVVQKGFSRFPVVDPASGQVTGLLHCKDLLLKQFVGYEGLGENFAPATPSSSSTGPTVKWLLKDLQASKRDRKVFVCGRGTTLAALLAEFKKSPHLAVVADCPENGEVYDPDVRHVGIITLHNIFEVIMQVPQGFHEAESRAPGRLHRQTGAVRLFDKKRLCSMAAEGTQLSMEEAEAVKSFLVSSQKAFSRASISDEALQELLRSLQPIAVSRRAELYSRGHVATAACLILQGAFKVATGEDQCETTVGPWSCIGTTVLSDRYTEAKAGARKDYIADFTATALTEGCIVLQIERDAYLEACQSSMLSTQIATQV